MCLSERHHSSGSFQIFMHFINFRLVIPTLFDCYVFCYLTFSCRELICLDFICFAVFWILLHLFFLCFTVATFCILFLLVTTLVFLAILLLSVFKFVYKLFSNFHCPILLTLIYFFFKLMRYYIICISLVKVAKLNLIICTF